MAIALLVLGVWVFVSGMAPGATGWDFLAERLGGEGALLRVLVGTTVLLCSAALYAAARTRWLLHQFMDMLKSRLKDGS